MPLNVTHQLTLNYTFTDASGSHIWKDLTVIIGSSSLVELSDEPAWRTEASKTQKKSSGEKFR